MIYYPQSVIPFENDVVPMNGLVSSRSIVGTALSSGKLVTRESSALLFSHFGFVGTVSTLRATVKISRLGRVSDKLVRFRSQNNWLGSNLAESSAEDLSTYTLSGSFLVDDSFGLVLDYAPHPRYPSSNTVYIRTVFVEFVI